MTSKAQQGMEYTQFPNLEKADFSEITSWIQREFLSKGPKYTRLTAHPNEPMIKDLVNIMYHIVSKFMWEKDLESPVGEAVTETVKALRLYVTNERVAAYLIEKPQFYEGLYTLNTCIFTKKNGRELCTKYVLQFFLNMLSAGNEEQKKYIRSKIRPHKLTNSFLVLLYHNYGHLYEVSAVLYNLYRDVEIKDDMLIGHLLQYHIGKDTTNEYLDFFVEKIISERVFWQCYPHIWLSARLELIKCLREMLIANSDNKLIIKVEQLPKDCLERLVRVFNRCADIVFQVTKKGDVSAIEEVCCVIELLAHFSGSDKYLPELQKQNNILINAGVLLIHAHRLGQESENVFTPLQKLSEIQNPGKEVRRNPVFGFKDDLVRIIGNLCWKNRTMQDLAREGEMIPVLLDSCNIDAKNPFIMQWVILAIRNILEDNADNQAVIAGLKQQGVVSSAVLQQCGLTLHEENDLSIGIVQLDINK